MKKQIFKIFIIAVVLALLVSVVSCTSQEKEYGELNELIEIWCENRSIAINTNNAELYLQGINEENSVLYKEESNLIDSLPTSYTEDFSLNFKIVDGDDDSVIVKLKQNYNDDVKREAVYDGKFILLDDKIIYDGINQKMMSNESVIIYYDKSLKKFASYIYNVANHYLNSMKNKRSYEPNSQIVFKLFSDQEVFLQSVKLDLPSWVGGWHEYGESIKIFSPYGFTGGYESMVYHECSHRYLSEISNDNASYWVQEGLAGLMEYNGGETLDITAFSKKDAIVDLINYKGEVWGFDEFTKINLEKLEQPELVSGYYALASLYVTYLIEELGEDNFIDALSTLSNNPLLEETAAEKIEVTTKMTNEVLSKALDMNYNEMCDNIDEYVLAKVLS